jgi:glycosyltransferase involved in cell wall biosynthesis
LIAGGPQRREEEKLLRSLERAAARAGLADRVRFLGQRTDVPDLLAAADILCQPNTSPEPFGVALVEGLAASLPVVTSALGGALEIVDATTGVLVAPGDAAALAEALRGLVDDPARRRALGAAGPARARALCDPTARVADLAALLAGLPVATTAGKGRG